MNSSISFLSKSLRCKCPKCHKGDLYKDRFFSTAMRDQCDACGFDFSKNDSADGPVVILTFIFGFLLVPLALLFENVFLPPLWMHAVVWTVVTIGLTMGTLRPLKSYIFALQFKHRPTDWD